MLGLMESSHLAAQKANFDSCASILQKVIPKKVHRKTYATLFHALIYNIFSKVDWGNIFSFLTRPIINKFTFSIYFSVSKNYFTLHTHILGKWVPTKTYICYISRSAILHFSIKHKCGTKYCSNRSRAVFMQEFLIFRTKNWSFLKLLYFCVFNEGNPIPPGGGPFGPSLSTFIKISRWCSSIHLIFSDLS